MRQYGDFKIEIYIPLGAVKIVTVGVSVILPRSVSFVAGELGILGCD